MSVQATTWVWAHSAATGIELPIMLAIADAANADGEQSCQSVGTLAQMCRIDRRTVQRHLRELEYAGEIIQTGVEPTYQTKVYAIPGVREGGRQAAAGGAAHGAKGGGTAAALPQTTYPKNASAVAEADRITPVSDKVRSSRRSTQTLVSAWVEGTVGGGLPRPPNQQVRKFGTHASGLVKELTQRNGTLTDCPDCDWQRALDTSYFLGTKAAFPLVAAYFGENGTPPDLPPDGNYALYESGGVALW